MHRTSLAVEIQESFEARPELRLLALRVRDPDAPPYERDACLREVALAYRYDRSWSPLLLELLAPAMAEVLTRLQCQDPVVAEDDLRQQLVLEVLEAANTMPLPLGMGFVETVIVLQASNEVVRLLEAEEAHRDWTLAMPDEDEDDDEEAEE